jgi:hypothetical protein
LIVHLGKALRKVITSEIKSMIGVLMILFFEFNNKPGEFGGCGCRFV